MKQEKQKKDALFIARKICAIILYVLTAGSIVADLLTNSQYYISFGGMIAFFVGVLVWPNKSNFCDKCGKRYEEESMKLLRTDKRYKESKEGTRIIYTHNISHICKCSCGNTYAYSLQEKGGYRVLDQNKNCTVDKTIPASKYLNPEKKND